MFDVVIRNYSLIGETNGERWLLTLLDEEPLVFDVGFHRGQSTREMLAARSASRVIAFDPSRAAREYYEAEFGKDARVVLEDIALSNAPGELEFFDYHNMCNSLAPRKESDAKPTVYVVPVTTLDSYCADHQISSINYMKVDAEGFDLHVLEGAGQLLSDEAIDIFSFEFASGWASSKRYLWEAAEFLEAFPYRLFHLFNGFLCPFEYDTRVDSCCTLSTMYVGVSEIRLQRGDIPLRNYRF